ncbi:unnamed protein product, partial [marine sediment metagenome]
FLSQRISFDEKTQKEIYQYLSSYRLEDALDNEQSYYLKEAFKRVLYTLAIIPEGNGKLLEIGSNPYYMSMLIRKFTGYELYFSNYFSTEYQGKRGIQYKINDENGDKIGFQFDHFNIEGDDIPFEDGFFDVILFCEIIEHLIHDPMKALLNIKKMLRPDGYLIFSTPNIARLENVAKLLVGENIYDPYSGYGPFGRHNREYSKHELFLMLTQLGFEIETMFTSDVAENFTDQIIHVSNFFDLVEYRK